MRPGIRTSAVLVAMFGLVLTSMGCQDAGSSSEEMPLEAMPDRTARPESQEAEQPTHLSQDPHVKALLEMAEKLRRRAEERGVVEEMYEARADRDAERAQELMGLSDRQVARLQRRLDRNREAILERYPDVRREVRAQRKLTAGPAAACPGSVLAAQGRRVQTASLGGAVLGAVGSVKSVVTGGSCEWLKFTAALAVCSSLGPTLYWPCAYLASCQYCENYFTNVAC